MTLLADTHINPTNPGNGPRSVFSLKHIFQTIRTCPADRHVLPPQPFPKLQLNQMLQSFQTIGFSSAELMTIALGFTPAPNPQPSCLSDPQTNWYRLIRKCPERRGHGVNSLQSTSEVCRKGLYENIGGRWVGSWLFLRADIYHLTNRTLLGGEGGSLCIEAVLRKKEHIYEF